MNGQRAQDIFCQMISRYPGICQSSAPAFRSVLWSFLGESEPWRIAVLVASFEYGAANLKVTADPRSAADSLVFALENGFGIAADKAIWAVSCWCKALGIAWKRSHDSGSFCAVSQESFASAEEILEGYDLIDTSRLEERASAVVEINAPNLALRLCPHCNVQNDTTSLYCRSCGKPLALLCPACDAEYHEGDAFCSKCGQKLPAATAPSASATVLDVALPVTAAYAHCQPGDLFRFGRFFQGQEGEVQPLEWLVLERQEDRLLAISRLGITCRQYHHINENITWEQCVLRRWLNGEFLHKAFSPQEKECIELTNVDNWDNDKYGTPGGNGTADQVFLLSLDEVNHYFSSDRERVCKPTPYAMQKGAYIEDGNCWWWLRSPGVDPIYAASVGSCGNICTDGNFVSDADDCVRPVINLKLSQ